MNKSFIRASLWKDFFFILIEWHQMSIMQCRCIFFCNWKFQFQFNPRIKGESCIYKHFFKLHQFCRITWKYLKQKTRWGKFQCRVIDVCCVCVHLIRWMNFAYIYTHIVLDVMLKKPQNFTSLRPEREKERKITINHKSNPCPSRFFPPTYSLLTYKLTLYRVCF